MTTPLRIAMISEHASPLAAAGGVDAGGQNIYVAHVARSLARRGHQVDVLTRRDQPQQPAAQALCPGVRVVHIQAGPARFVPKERLLVHMPEFAAAAESLVRHSGPYDLAHANFFMSGVVAQQLKRALALPYVMTFHALGLVRREHQREADAFPPERAAIERALVHDADLVLPECPQDAADLERLYGAAAARLRMVPCGFDPAEFRPMSRARARAQLGLPQDEFIVLQLGRLVPRKGIDNVIEAMALLPPGAPRARLLVVGGESRDPDERITPEIARLRGVAEAAGVAGRVSFVGQRRRDELRRFYAAADVFVTTPWYEPFGITPLEAMACGIPVVGSDVGGIRYSVREGESGFLVPPHHPSALARRLQLLMEHPALAAAMGRAGLQRARSMFTWDEVARQLLAVYEEVRERRTQPADAAWTLPLPAAAAAAQGVPMA